MIVPIQDIMGLVFNEYINLDNALKILSKLPRKFNNKSLKIKILFQFQKL